MLKMRDFTQEESESYSKALDSIYKPTGINIYNMEDGNMFNYVKVNGEEDFSEDEVLDNEGETYIEEVEDFQTRKQELAGRLAVMGDRLDQLSDEFNCTVAEMRSQIETIYDMLSEL